MWLRRFRRILVGVLAVAIVVAALYLAVKPFRVAVLTMALVPELLEAAPRPLSAVTPDPRRISVTYGEPRPDRMDLYLPMTSPVELGSMDRYPTLMLVLGVSPLPLEDERVVRLATAVARLGFVVAAPESSEMRQRRILPEERDRLISAFEVVAARPEVDPDRIGMAGFSVGAGIALLAAADPRIADRVRYVNAFGSYGDAPALLVELATRSMVVDGERRPWRPGDLSREVFLQLVLELVDEAGVREQIRRRIEPVILGDGPTIESYDPEFAETLEGDARAVYRLVRPRTHRSARRPSHRSRSRRGRASPGSRRISGPTGCGPGSTSCTTRATPSFPSPSWSRSSRRSPRIAWRASPISGSLITSPREGWNRPRSRSCGGCSGICGPSRARRSERRGCRVRRHGASTCYSASGPHYG